MVTRLLRPSALRPGLLLAVGVPLACSPMMSGPPPVPLMSAAGGEPPGTPARRMGGAVNAATYLPRSELSKVEEDQNGFGGGATLWIGRSLGDHGEIGAIADFAMLRELGYLGYFDKPSLMPSGGMYLRRDLTENPDTYIGISGSIGWLYGTVGAPMAWRLNDRVWLYSHPELGLALSGVAQLPVGVVIESEAGRGQLTAELGVNGPVIFGARRAVVPYVSVGYELLR